MKRIFTGLLLFTFSVADAATGNCDLTEFRWMCKLPVRAAATFRTPYALDCNKTRVYVTHSQYQRIMEYQHAYVNMTLKVNGEFISGPCVPGKI